MTAPTVKPAPAFTPERVAELFRILAQETRLRLLLILADGEHAVGELDAVSGIGQPGLSQQLAILRKAGLVATRRVAKQVYYRIEPATLAHAAALLAQLSGMQPALIPGKLVEPKPPRARPAGSSARFAKML